MSGSALKLGAAVLALAACSAPAGTWYIPVCEQIPGGFDHIQIRMLYPYHFDSPAMSAFCGPSPVGEDWSQTFLNGSQVFATADGPSPGNEEIHFAIWIGGDPQVHRPAFQFQVYRGQFLVDNADFICFGPGEMDWMIAPGTWSRNKPIPPWIPGDANYDAYVDGADYTIWADHYFQAGGWEEGDFNDDGFVDGADYTIWADHYTGVGGSPGQAEGGSALAGQYGGVSVTLDWGDNAAAPEPGTLALMILGAGAAMVARRRKR